MLGYSLLGKKRSRLVALLLLLIFFTSPRHAVAQSGSIRGYVKDSVKQQSIKNGRVYLLDNDFRQIMETGIEETGKFEFNKVASGLYTLQSDIPGYKSFSTIVSLNEKQDTYDSGIHYLTGYVINLDTLIIKPNHPSIIFRKDTTDYHADSFETPPNSAVEELLTRLPGIFISNEGKIYANGKEVTKILVDGEPFFGGDLKFAIKNLPAEIIDLVQVYNAASDLKNLTGMDDGQKTKTLNLKIKEGRKKGNFGLIGAGAGFKEIFDIGGSLNTFKNKRQVSFGLQSTNSSSSLFSSFMPNNNGQNGLTKANSTGVNFKDEFGKHTKVSASYIAIKQRTESVQLAYTQFFFPKDSTTLNTVKSRMIRSSYTHQVNVNIQSKLTSSTQLIIRPQINIGLPRIKNELSGTLETNKSDLDTIYSNNNSRVSNLKVYNFGSKLIVSHFFKKKLRSLNMNSEIRATQNTDRETNLSLNSFYIPFHRLTTINQLKENNRSGRDLSLDLSFLEPVGSSQILGISYSYRSEIKTNNIDVFKYNIENKNYSILDSLQTNSSKNTLNVSEFLLRYQLNKAKYIVHISNGLSYQSFSIYNYFRYKKSSVGYLNLKPSVNLEYNFSNEKSFQLSYNLTFQQPDLSQLQEVITTSDSLFIYNGNPDLRQAQLHNFLMAYKRIFFKNKASLSTDISGTIIKNDIQYAITNLSSGAQITKPINVRAGYNITGSLDYTIPVRNSSFQINSAINYISNKAVLNEESTNISSYNLRARFGFSSTFSNSTYLNIYTNTNYSWVDYLASSITKNRYLIQGIVANVRYHPKTSGFFVSSIMDINYNTGSPNNASRKFIPIISASIGKYLSKKKDLEVKLIINDILDRSASSTTETYQNSIRTTQTNSRGRYIMTSLVYNYKKFGGKVK